MKINLTLNLFTKKAKLKMNRFCHKQYCHLQSKSRTVIIKITYVNIN